MSAVEEEIEADNIDEAAGKLLGYLEDTSKGNVIYFHGWASGLGASAVLKLVARRLQSSSTTETAFLNPRLKFDKIIHVDFSVWKSRRALQKAIAEELQLPSSVMAIFDQCDEEDDVNMVDEASRAEIADVGSEIYKCVKDRRILVILHNGSSDYVDLNDFVIPVYWYLSNKVLWTFGGRFRFLLQPKEKNNEKMAELIQKMEQSDVFIVATHAHEDEADEDEDEADEDQEEIYDKWWDLMREEAEEVARYAGIPDPGMNRKMVEDCILYMWALRGVDSIDWEAHASNYWVCDGIIQQEGGGGDRSAWEVADALHRNMRLDWDGWEIVSGAISHYKWRPNDRWISATPQYLKKSSSGLPPEATSFFLAVEPPIDTVLSADMFQHPDSMLRVIQLSSCTFSFASPPFLCCRNLRFLLLDHCRDGPSGSADIIKGSADGGVIERSRNGSWRACFQKLWVLDLSYTDWYWLLSEEMIILMAELRELNVKGVKHWSQSHFHGGGTRDRTWLLNLVKLRVTVEPTDDITQAPTMAEFPNMSSTVGLKEVILSGCVGLEKVSHNALPPSLESFTFSVGTSMKAEDVGESGGSKEASTSAMVNSISFWGCAQLKSALLRGLLGTLWELDMSGTAVKTLDLSAMQAPQLKRLILLGCEKLRAILWPPEDEMPKDLEMLRIDTTRFASADVARRSSVSHGGQAYSEWYVCVRDARLLRLLVPAKYFGPPRSSGLIFVIRLIHIEISTPASVIFAGGSKTQGVVRSSSSSNNTTNNILNTTSGSVFSEKQVLLSLQQPGNLYADVITFKDHLQAANGGHAPEITWPYHSSRDCYMHIQDEMKTKLQRGSKGTITTLPDYVCDWAAILHMHDSLSITSISAPAVGSRWDWLNLCLIERCPELQGSVFSVEDSGQDEIGAIIFRSLRTFWASQLLKVRYIWNWSTVLQLGELSFVFLEYLYLDRCPRLIHVLPVSTSMTSVFHRLETLEIVWCGDLRKVFRLDTKRQEQSSPLEFPSLKHIHLHELPMLQHICGRWMYAPKLETAKIRGCWSLRRLPAVSRAGKFPRVDCEKEWWDSLEWDGLDPSLYRPTHSRYYKKKLPRGSLLR